MPHPKDIASTIHDTLVATTAMKMKLTMVRATMRITQLATAATIEPPQRILMEELTTASLKAIKTTLTKTTRRLRTNIGMLCMAKKSETLWIGMQMTSETLSKVLSKRTAPMKPSDIIRLLPSAMPKRTLPTML